MIKLEVRAALYASTGSQFSFAAEELRKVRVGTLGIHLDPDFFPLVRTAASNRVDPAGLIGYQYGPLFAFVFFQEFLFHRWAA